MRHVVIAGESLLSGDEAVGLLIEYATLLGQRAGADSIDLRAIDAGGDEVTATFLLNSGTSLVAESARSTLPEPDNAKVEQFLHDRIARLRTLDSTSPEEVAGGAFWNAESAGE